MRLALHNHDDVVTLGLAMLLNRYARDIDMVDLDTRTTHHIDLVLLEPAGPPAEDHPGLLRKLIADPRVRRIAILTRSFEVGAADIFFASGCAGYLSTGLPAHELVNALRAIHDGRQVVAPRDVPDVGGGLGQEHGLTQRESDVLGLIASGFSNQDIATELHLSINSVKSYVRSAYSTIGVDSRTKAVVWTLTHGLPTFRDLGTHTSPSNGSARPTVPMPRRPRRGEQGPAGKPSNRDDTSR